MEPVSVENNISWHRDTISVLLKELEETDEEGNVKEVFIPVSSIIHTIDSKDNRDALSLMMPGSIPATLIFMVWTSSLNDQTSS